MSDLLGRVKGFIYMKIMILAHKYSWHYMPHIHPEGDTQAWCKWCGIRVTIATKESRARTLRGLTKHT